MCSNRDLFRRTKNAVEISFVLFTSRCGGLFTTHIFDYYLIQTSDGSDTRFFLGGSNCGPPFQQQGFNQQGFNNPCGRRKRQVGSYSKSKRSALWSEMVSHWVLVHFWYSQFISFHFLLNVSNDHFSPFFQR
jgi:hypothetical protein